MCAVDEDEEEEDSSSLNIFFDNINLVSIFF